MEADDFDKYVERRKGVTKWEGFKFRVRTKWEEFKAYIGKYSLTEILTTLTAAVSLFGVIFKALRSLKKSGTQQLAEQREFTYYDPHTGIRWDLKRKMTNNEKSELRVRMDAGEPVEEILKDLGVYQYR